MTNLSQLNPEQFDIFISYARKDNTFGQVDSVVNWVNSHALTSGVDPSFSIFFDKKGIQTGERWADKIRSAIHQSKILLIFVSRHYFASEWCRKEWNEFLQVEKARQFPVECVYPVFIESPATISDGLDRDSRQWHEQVTSRQGVSLFQHWLNGDELLKAPHVLEVLDHMCRRATNRIAKARLLILAPRNIPDSISGFVGRETQLARMQTELSTFERGAICAVNGPPGIGKSSLAIHFAYRFRPAYLGGQFRIDMSEIHSEFDFGFQLIFLARERLGCEVPPDSPHDHQLAHAKAAFESRPNGHRILLILDNLYEKDINLVSKSNRIRLLPSREKVDVLITTRVDDQSLGDIPILNLDRLSSVEAVDLLWTYRSFPLPDNRIHTALWSETYDVSTNSFNASDPEWMAALSIVNRLGRHTLAVAMVGAYLSVRTDLSYAEFRVAIDEFGIGLALDRVGNDAAVRQVIAHPQTMIGQLFEPTIQWLKSRSPCFLRLLEYASLLPADGIYIEWLDELIRNEQDLRIAFTQDPFEPKNPFPDMLRTLSQMQLLVGEPVAQMHRVLKSVIQSRMSIEVRENRFDAISHYFHERSVAMIHARGEISGTVRREVESISEFCQSQTDSSNLILARCCINLAHFLVRMQRRNLAMLLLKRGIRTLRQHESLNPTLSRALAIAFSRLSEVARHDGRMEDERRYLQESIDICESHLAVDPSSDLQIQRLTDLLALTRNVTQTGRYGRAHELLELLDTIVPNHSNPAIPNNVSMAWIYECRGRLADAEGDLDEARRHFEMGYRCSVSSAKSGGSFRKTCVSLESLAVIALKQGRTNDAVELYEEELAIASEMYDSSDGLVDHLLFIARVEFSLADAFAISSRIPKAVILYNESLSKFQRAFDDGYDLSYQDCVFVREVLFKIRSLTMQPTDAIDEKLLTVILRNVSKPHLDDEA